LRGRGTQPLIGGLAGAKVGRFAAGEFVVHPDHGLHRGPRQAGDLRQDHDALGAALRHHVFRRRHRHIGKRRDRSIGLVKATLFGELGNQLLIDPPVLMQ
jgi:hypothetical protein